MIRVVTEVNVSWQLPYNRLLNLQRFLLPVVHFDVYVCLVKTRHKLAHITINLDWGPFFFVFYFELKLVSDLYVLKNLVFRMLAETVPALGD